MNESDHAKEIYKKGGLPEGFPKPERKELVRREHPRRAKSLLFVVTPFHACEDKVCLARQGRLRGAMKEMVEVFEPEAVEEIAKDDWKARAERGVPDLWTYDPLDDDDPVTPLDELAVVEFLDGDKKVFAVLDVPALLQPAGEAPATMYG